jgi:hypothetical protein
MEAWHRSDVIFALVAPSIAPAAPQKPKHALVVPFQPIGKITFGINESKAFRVWSKPVGHVLVTVGLLAELLPCSSRSMILPLGRGCS